MSATEYEIWLTGWGLRWWRYSKAEIVTNLEAAKSSANYWASHGHKVKVIPVKYDSEKRAASIASKITWVQA